MGNGIAPEPEWGGQAVIHMAAANGCPLFP